MEELSYSPRELGLRKFKFDIGDIVYYHFTGEYKSSGGSIYSNSLPYDIPINYSSHFLVIDFFIGACNIDGVSVDILREHTFARIQNISDGNIFSIATNRKTYLHKKMIRSDNRTIDERMFGVSTRYLEDENDPGEERLIFKIFKISSEDQKAFERVMKLTSWFIDSRNNIQNLKNQLREKV